MSTSSANSGTSGSISVFVGEANGDGYGGRIVVNAGVSDAA